MKTISFIGGDLRTVRLIELYRNEKNIIKTFGLEKSKEIINKEKFNSISESIENSDLIVSSIPFSKDSKNVFMPLSEIELSIDEFFYNIKNNIIIAGSIPENIKKENNKIYDFMEYEELAVSNVIATSEGAIQIAMENTEQTLHNSKVLILGFGRIGKILAKNLNALGAKVTCEARKESDLAWINAYGYDFLELKYLDKNINKFDIIFNTIPKMILDKNKLSKVKRNVLIIDLASKPGGTDFKECDKLGIKYNFALGLPGKVAPLTSAKYLKEITDNILQT